MRKRAPLPLVCKKAILQIENAETELIDVEGAQTPTGGRDKGDPARRSLRRLPDRPWKAKRLERRSTVQCIIRLYGYFNSLSEEFFLGFSELNHSCS
ncbi:hypothetical protein AB685_14290 [Bacillus sp. LL01]|nr:hypothetical protein AB685_14290 [Bacillus sp. LL01]